MPRGRKSKSKRRSGKNAFRILGALEAYTYLSIASRGVMGTSPYGVLSGKADLRLPVSTYSGPDTFANPDGIVTLKELKETPDLAIQAMAMNARSNVLPIVGATIVTGIGFRFARKLMRRQISSVQNNLINPVLGKNVVRLA